MTSGRLRGRITGGIRERMSSPRSGIERPETNSVITMTTNGTASVRPSFAHSGHQSFVLDEEQQLGLQHAERQTPDEPPPDRRQSGDQRDGQRGHDEQRQVARRHDTDRRAGDDEDGADVHRRQHPRDRAERRRREAGEGRRPLVLGGGLDGDTRSRPGEPDGEHRGQHHDEAGQPQSVDRDGEPGDRDAAAREHGRPQPQLGAVRQRDRPPRASPSRRSRRSPWPAPARCAAVATRPRRRAPRAARRRPATRRAGPTSAASRRTTAAPAPGSGRPPGRCRRRAAASPSPRRRS